MKLEDMIKKLEDITVDSVVCEQSELTTWLKELQELRTKHTILKSFVRDMFNREEVLRTLYFTTDGSDKLAIRMQNDELLSEIKNRLWDEIGR